MERKIDGYLKNWKESPVRKPLLIQGAGQVGKTYSALAFGRDCYDSVAYFNFKTDIGIAMLFEESTSPEHLVPLLTRVSGQNILPEKTLIIFDEIENCDRAIAALGSFARSKEDYHVIAIGKMVDQKIQQHCISLDLSSFERVSMGPLDFEEFLVARGEKPLRDQIRFSYLHRKNLPSVLHGAAVGYYRQYLIVGGMPLCVEKYLETKDPILIHHLQIRQYMSYWEEAGKRNRVPDAKKARLIYENLETQLSGSTTTFRYKLLKKGGRRKEFDEPALWLSAAGLAHRVPMVRDPEETAKTEARETPFKLFYSDVGILSAKKSIAPEDLLYPSEAGTQFRNALVENYVCQQLVSCGYNCFFWQSPRGAEVDFLIRKGDDVIPVQVKSADNPKAKGLLQYMKQNDAPYGINLSIRNFSFEGKRITLPIYAAFCI